MNKIRIFSVFACIVPILLGCNYTKTEAEHWRTFCQVYEGAAYNIMFDRQNDIPREKAIQQLKKIPEGIPRNMLIQLIDEAQRHPKLEQLGDKKQAATRFQQGRYETCLKTPH